MLVWWLLLAVLFKSLSRHESQDSRLPLSFCAFAKTTRRPRFHQYPSAVATRPDCCDEGREFQSSWSGVASRVAPITNPLEGPFYIGPSTMHADERVLSPQLQQTPFSLELKQGGNIGQEIKAMIGLVAETVQDVLRDPRHKLKYRRARGLTAWIGDPLIHGSEFITKDNLLPVASHASWPSRVARVVKACMATTTTFCNGSGSIVCLSASRESAPVVAWAA